jgi:nucleolar protein 4
MADSDAAKDLRTVFVRGISFDVQDEKPLEALFSDVGPVKQCFLVRAKGEDKHKGMGFVTFALPEDAARAIEQLNHTKLEGRKLLVRCQINALCMQHRQFQSTAMMPRLCAIISCCACAAGTG